VPGNCIPSVKVKALVAVAPAAAVAPAKVNKAGSVAALAGGL
jgi:hypothetical protein